MNEFTKIPNMVLHKDDVKEFYPEADEISKEDMDKIARLLGKCLMQEWNMCLRIAVEEWGNSNGKKI